MKLNQHLRDLLRDKAGNTLAIFAVALVPLTAMIGIGMDLGINYMARAKLQNACDAGVLAGRQAMQGTVWNSASEEEADKFFRFNFPEGTHGAVDVAHTFEQNASERAEILGTARAVIPTSLMHIFGFASLPISVECNAKRDLGHNDIMMVLDVTGSMAQSPSTGGASKISRLRTGAMGLYRALEDDGQSTTRFGIMPYSWTVNVGGSLADSDILDRQQFIDVISTPYRCGWNNNSTCYSYSWGEKTVRIADSASKWKSRQLFRDSGDACIEERFTIGASPMRIGTTVSQADIDSRAPDIHQTALQFGRYDPGAHTRTGSVSTTSVRVGNSNLSFSMQHGCPSEARRLQEYGDEAAFRTAINSATARVTGGTYHDVGMLWGLRFLSRTGFFAADNPTEIDQVPVNQHIVFMTDGRLEIYPGHYSSHSVENRMSRTPGTGTLASRHLARFNSICNRAKAMGVTIWVIALDVTDIRDITPCATTPSHFYTSDGSDLEEVFAAIGQGIGNLRLTR